MAVNQNSDKLPAFRVFRFLLLSGSKKDKIRDTANRTIMTPTDTQLRQRISLPGFPPVFNKLRGMSRASLCYPGA